MTIDIGAMVDGPCPRCSANALVVTAITDGQINELRCRECSATYPDDADADDSDDAPRQRKRAAPVKVVASSMGSGEQRRQTTLDADLSRESQPRVGRRRQRIETLIDFELNLPERPKD